MRKEIEGTDRPNGIFRDEKGINSTLVAAKDKISEPENIDLDIIQNKARDKRLQKKSRPSVTCENTKW